MLPLDKTRNLNTIICDPQATVSGMCGTGIIIQGRIVHESILRKKALSGTEMIPKQYSTPLRHRILVGLHMENKHLLGIYLTSGTILNPDLPSGNKMNNARKPCTATVFGHFLFRGVPHSYHFRLSSYCHTTYSVSISATSLCLFGYKCEYVFSVVFISL